MKRVSLFFLIVGIILIISSSNFDMTGGVIGEGIFMKSNYLLFAGIFLLILSFFLNVKGSLEAIVIPTGNLESDKKRTSVAMDEYRNSGEKSYVLVSGAIARDEDGRVKKDAQPYQIYKELREKYGLKPKDMIIEGKSNDTLENFLYSVKKTNSKGINQLDIATNKTQYWRFKMFEKQAKEEGIIGDSFNIRPIYTKESFGEFLYGVLALAKDYFRIKSSDSLVDASKKSTGSFGNFMKRFFKRD